jgi:hypothetical protein
MVVVCPKCNERIDEVLVASLETIYYRLRFNGKEADWENDDSEPSCHGNDKYYCPNCDMQLSFLKREEDVEKFLNGD